MPTSPRKLLLVNLAWGVIAVLGLVVMYVLSYPFVVRSTGASDMTVYRPVQWLVDETSAREPMLWLADACGCGAAVRDASFERALLIRDQHWQIDVPVM